MNKEKREYVECVNIINRLMYIGPRGSLLQVDFDMDSEPSIRCIGGELVLAGVPQDEKERLLKKIKEKYPHGLHTRTNVGFKWLKKRLEELAIHHSVIIKSIEPYGCLMVDGCNYDAYKVDIDIKSIQHTVYVIMMTFTGKFLVFRPYDLKGISSQNEIISYKEYTYDEDVLKEEAYGIKSKKNGNIKKSKFGSFVIVETQKY